MKRNSTLLALFRGPADGLGAWRGGGLGLLLLLRLLMQGRGGLGRPSRSSVWASE